MTPHQFYKQNPEVIPMKKWIIVLFTLLLAFSLSLSVFAAEDIADGSQTEAAAAAQSAEAETVGQSSSLGSAGTIVCAVAGVAVIALMLPTFKEKRR